MPKNFRCQGNIFKNVPLCCKEPLQHCFVNTLTELGKSVILFLLRDVCMELTGTVLFSCHVNQSKLFSIRIFQLPKLCPKSSILKVSKKYFLKDLFSASVQHILEYNYLYKVCVKAFILRMPYSLKIPSTKCCHLWNGTRGSKCPHTGRDT